LDLADCNSFNPLEISDLVAKFFSVKKFVQQIFSTTADFFLTGKKFTNELGCCVNNS